MRLSRNPVSLVKKWRDWIASFLFFLKIFMFQKFKSPIFLACIIAALTFLAYSFALNDSFKTLDDDASIVENQSIKDFAHVDKIFKVSFFGRGSYYRPLIQLSFMLEHHFFGTNAFYYYLTNIMIHAINALFVFAIMTRLLKYSKYPNASFSGALIFAIHPIHWEAVSNISGRGILLCTFFLLGTFYLFINTEKRKLLMPFAVLSFALALLCKESAGVFPLVLLAYQFFVEKPAVKKAKGTKCNWLESFSLVIPFFILNGIYLFIRHSLNITKLYYWRNLNEWALGFLTFLRSVITDIRLLVFPVDLIFDRSRKLFVRFFDVELILTVLFFAGLVSLIWRYRKKFTPLQKFFIVWPCIELLPVSQLLTSIGTQPGYISTAEHFLYMPSIGIFALAAMLLSKLCDENKAREIIPPNLFIFAVSGACVFFFMSTIQHNIYSSNEIAMFERSLKFNPDNVRIRNSLAFTYAKSSRFKEAEKHFRKTLEIIPNDAWALIGLGKALCDQGKYVEGLKVYESVRDAGGREVTLEENKKATYRILQGIYEEMLKDDASDPDIHYSLAVAYSVAGKFKEAAMHYEKAIDLKSDFRNALFNLGSIYGILGDDEKAARYYTQALSKTGSYDDMDREVYRALGQIYQMTGDVQKAREYNRKAGE